MSYDSFTPERDEDIRDAAEWWEVPYDVLKAAIIMESNGNWERDGDRVVKINRPSGVVHLLPYVGLSSSSGVDVVRLRGDHRGQVFALAREIATIRSRVDVWAAVMYERYSGASLAQSSQNTFVQNFMKIRQHIQEPEAEKTPVGY